MYLDSDHQFLNLVGKSKANCVVLKFNTRFRDIEPKYEAPPLTSVPIFGYEFTRSFRYKNERDGLHTFAEEVREHLTRQKIIHNSESFKKTIGALTPNN